MISLPTEVAINNSQKIEFSCGGTLSGFYNTKLYCIISGKNIYVQKGFLGGYTSDDPPILVFTVPYLNNPRSTAATSGFGIQIIDANERPYYKSTTTTV